MIEDLNLYNPTRLPVSNYNVLTELAHPFDGKTNQPKTTGRGACHHKWMIKPNGCTSLLADRADGLVEQRVAAFCSECRCHVTLDLGPEGGLGLSPCPNADYPLHHFRYASTQSAGLQVHGQNPKTDDWEDQETFECSNPKCSMHLHVHLRSPRLRPEWVELLADKLIINKRAQDAIAADPGRLEGHPVPPPTQVMSNLKTYVTDALKGDGKRILSINKKFVLSLGEPCAELLRNLGFTQRDDFWMPPEPSLQDTPPFQNPLNILLDDVDKELAALILRQPEEDRRIARFNFSLSSATKDFRSFLGYREYKTDPAKRTVDLTKEEPAHPYYAGLGALIDFHDDLISFAYDRQIACDEENIPYYLECFQGIATGRKSQDLQIKAAVEASTGKKSLQDVREAYKAFGLSMDESLADDSIIGSFQARIIDSQRQEPQLREHLAAIGQHRGSLKIQHFAENSESRFLPIAGYND